MRIERRVLLILAGAWLVSFLLWMTPGLLRPDGVGCVSYLPSTWFDGDLLFYDEWARAGLMRDGIVYFNAVTPNGHLANPWPSGSAMLWYPAFVLADALRPWLAPTFPRDGFSLPYNVALVAASAFIGLMTLLTGAAVARRHAGEGATLAAALAAWFGTPLLWYSLRHATMSHAATALMCGLVFAGALALRERREVPVAVLTGIAAGLAFSVRPQEGPFALVPLIVAPLLSERRLLAAYAAGGLLGASPHLIITSYLGGSPIAVLTGGSEKAFAAFQRPYIPETLFSWYHGLFTWTPFTIVAFVGLALLWRRDRRLVSACLLVFAIDWIVNGILDRSFWGAVAFGQRRFLDCTVIFMLGGAVAFERMNRVTRAVVATAVAGWTMAIFFGALAGLPLGRYTTAAELFAWQGRGIASAGKFLAPLASVPPQFRVTVVAIAVAVFVMLAALIYALRRNVRIAAGVAVAYLLAMGVFLTVCGARGMSRLPELAPVIARNAVLTELPGGAHWRGPALMDEVDYLRRRGSEEEAAALEREVMELSRRRAAALRMHGIPADR